MTITRNQIESFTHNKLKIFDSCKRRYYYEYIRKLHWPDLTADFELGLSIHKLLDYQAKGLETELFIPTARKDISDMWKDIQKSDLIKQPVIESEWAFNIKLSEVNTWLEGRIDRLIKKNDSEKFVVVDFKTGQNLPSAQKEDWQSMVYLYAVAIAKNISPDDLEFWYYKTDQEPEYRKITYTNDQHKLFHKKIIAKIEEINTTATWLTAPQCDKKFCQYSKLCSTEG